jgi:hypothetical protein
MKRAELAVACSAPWSQVAAALVLSAWYLLLPPRYIVTATGAGFVDRSAPLSKWEKWTPGDFDNDATCESARSELVRVAHLRMSNGEDDRDQDQKVLDEAILASACIARNDPRLAGSGLADPGPTE